MHFITKCIEVARSEIQMVSVGCASSLLLITVFYLGRFCVMTEWVQQQNRISLIGSCGTNPRTGSCWCQGAWLCRMPSQITVMAKGCDLAWHFLWYNASMLIRPTLPSRVRGKPQRPQRHCRTYYMPWKVSLNHVGFMFSITLTRS